MPDSRRGASSMTARPWPQRRGSGGTTRMHPHFGGVAIRIRRVSCCMSIGSSRWCRGMPACLGHVGLATWGWWSRGALQAIGVAGLLLCLGGQLLWRGCASCGRSRSSWVPAASRRSALSPSREWEGAAALSVGAARFTGGRGAQDLSRPQPKTSSSQHVVASAAAALRRL